MTQNEVTQIPFTIDPLFAIRTLLKIHLDKQNDKDVYEDDVAYALSDMLYTNPLTDEEVDIIFTRYTENHGIKGRIELGGDDEQIPEVFGYIFDLERYKQAHIKHIPYAVIDNRTGNYYPTKHTEHYATLLKIIQDEYSKEFVAMTDPEKDNFILTNFTLIGPSRKPDWYIGNIKTMIYVKDE